jgi:hypothetical protein
MPDRVVVFDSSYPSVDVSLPIDNVTIDTAAVESMLLRLESVRKH